MNSEMKKSESEVTEGTALSEENCYASAVKEKQMNMQLKG